MEIERKLKHYQYTAIISLVFALAGFSYNAWRLEVSETNNTIRMASFQILLELGQLEQLIYAAHYDKDSTLGNPRNGWVKVGLINDLSMLTSNQVITASEQLRYNWQQHWDKMAAEKTSTELLVDRIDNVRKSIKNSLQQRP